MPRPDSRCPCTSGRKYKRCCGPAHGGRPASDAHALMRSRYSAYKLGLIDYLIATTDPEGPMWEDDHDEWAQQIRDFVRYTHFVGLTVHAFKPPSAEDPSATLTAMVHFTAHLRRDGLDVSMTERSLFRRLDGRWLYSSKQD